jgi:hypothetical protein
MSAWADAQLAAGSIRFSGADDRTIQKDLVLAANICEPYIAFVFVLIDVGRRLLGDWAENGSK